MNLVTTCPHCGTVFRMVREQLDASDGRVRCGHCLEVFDAKTQLQTTQAEPTAETAAHLSFVKQAHQQAFWTQPAVRFGLVLLAFALSIALAIQVLRGENDRFHTQSGALATTIQEICKLWTCSPVVRRNIDAWQIESTQFEKDTSKPQTAAFRLSLHVKNTASTSLLLPHLEISLLDASETLLARHVVRLGNDKDHTTVPSLEERRFQLLISPSTHAAFSTRDMVGYRVVLFYP